MTPVRISSLVLLGAAFALAVAACGGGTDGTGAVPDPNTTVTSSGVMTRGSVILNGTRFDADAATVGDDRNRTAAQLDSGMVIKLRGRSSDGVNGVAERIDIENEVRGAIQSVDGAADPRRFHVAGLTVVVDDLTLYANLAGFDALAPGTRVEVHGLRDASGWMRASRVEAVGAQDSADELRGALTGLRTDLDQLTLGSIVVNYAGALFGPAGASEASLAAGKVVEVRGTLVGNVLAATHIEVEDMEDAAYRGAPGDKQAVEGYITGYTTHPGTFQVNGQLVRTTAATKFQHGTAAELIDDVYVEVTGTLDEQFVLVASRVSFKRTRVILEGLATAVDVQARQLTVFGQTVHVNDLTRIDARVGPGAPTDSLGDVVANVDCVEARGHMEGTRFVAERVRELVNCGADVLQARVTDKDEAGATLEFFGGLVAALPVAAEYRDADDVLITRAEFLSLVTPASAGGSGTLVRMRGTFAGGVFTATVAEIKN